MPHALVRSRAPAWLAAPLAWLCVTAPSAFASDACFLQPVPIQPAASEPTDTYVGRTAALELRFHNDKTSGPVDVFPEPPLTVKQLGNQTECAIQDGGIWVRRHVWASADGRTLVTHEYSGSNDELVFYDTRSCARTAAIDVTGTQWTVDGRTVAITQAGKRKSRVALDAACRPAGPRR